MAADSKIRRLLTTSRDPQEVQDWIFSLTPLGVAFAFFLVFLLPMEIEHKDIILVTGIAAGFTGLQTYWIFRGWRKNHAITILLGLVGIGLTISFAWFYTILT